MYSLQKHFGWPFPLSCLRAHPALSLLSPSRGPGLLCHGFISLMDASSALSLAHHQAAKMSDDAWQAHVCSLSDARLLFGETHPVLPNLRMAALPLLLLLGGTYLRRAHVCLFITHRRACQRSAGNPLPGTLELSLACQAPSSDQVANSCSQLLVLNPQSGCPALRSICAPFFGDQVAGFWTQTQQALPPRGITCQVRSLQRDPSRPPKGTSG